MLGYDLNAIPLGAVFLYELEIVRLPRHCNVLWIMGRFTRADVLESFRETLGCFLDDNFAHDIVRLVLILAGVPCWYRSLLTCLTAATRQKYFSH